MRTPDLNDLLMDLQLAKQIAIEDRNPNALILGTIAQAKLLGIERPQLIDVNDNAVQSISDLMNELSKDETTRTINHA